MKEIKDIIEGLTDKPTYTKDGIDVDSYSKRVPVWAIEKFDLTQEVYLNKMETSCDKYQKMIKQEVIDVNGATKLFKDEMIEFMNENLI